MAVTAFQDYPLASRDMEWDGAAAEKRIRAWAGAEDEPNEKYRDSHIWYDSASKDNFTAYKMLIADVVDGQVRALPRGIMAAANVMQGARGGRQGGHRTPGRWFSLGFARPGNFAPLLVFRSFSFSKHTRRMRVGMFHF